MRKIILAALLLIPAIAVEQELMQSLIHLGRVVPQDIMELYSQFEEGDLQKMDFGKDILVIVGENLDVAEQKMEAVFTDDIEKSPWMRERLASELTGNETWLNDYNLILIGGPEHNSITKYLSEHRTFNFTERNSNRPKIIIQMAAEGEKTILLVSSSYSYPTKEGVMPVEDKAKAVATAVAVTTAASVGVSVAASAAAAPGVNILSEILDFLQGGVHTYAEDLVEEKEEEVEELVKSGKPKPE